MKPKIIETKELKKYFLIKKGLFQRRRAFVRAVDGVNIYIEEGESFGLAGESGCGKTTLGRLSLGALEPTSGTVLFKGQDVHNMNEEENKEFRRLTQMIFQDVYASLNPRKTVWSILSQPLIAHHAVTSKSELENRVVELLEKVGLGPSSIDKYPHEFSGGERQRIVIARAMSLNPKFIVADEPVSSLDMSIRGQILNLMKKLQTETQVAYLLISHDLALLRSMCKRIAIMYLGKIIEYGETEKIFNSTLHPYTQALLSSVPVPNPKVAHAREPIILKGEASTMVRQEGCRFQNRCLFRQSRCQRVEPELIKVGKEHFVACYRL